MASDRVEPRTVLVGLGMGTTPERIQELEARARKLQHEARPKPQKPFSAVLALATQEGPAQPLSEKQQKHEALPKKGPRPALSHPGQRETFGRTSDGTDTVVIKG